MSSSSTRRTVSEPRESVTETAAFGELRRPHGPREKHLDVEPWPTCCRLDVAPALLHDAVHGREPRPVPFPCSFVVKNGSKRCERISVPSRCRCR